MDIFVINTNNAQNIDRQLLLEFKKKEISNASKLSEHCLSYLMVDRILKEFYGIENREIIFSSGKPILKSAQKHFSLSHSGDYIALAFSDYNCGIDIEQNTTRDFTKIAQRMNFNSKTIEEFYVDWTIFEAKYKLNSDPKISKTYQLGAYTLSIVSENIEENFELYLQRVTI